MIASQVRRQVRWWGLTWVSHSSETPLTSGTLETGGDGALDKMLDQRVPSPLGDAAAELLETLVEQILVRAFATDEVTGDEIHRPGHILVRAIGADRVDGVVERPQNLHVAVLELGDSGQVDIEPDPLDGTCQLSRSRHGQVQEIVEVGQLQDFFRGRPAEDGACIPNRALEGFDDLVAALARRSGRLFGAPVAERNAVGEDPDPIAHRPGVQGAEAGAEQFLIHEPAAESFRQARVGQETAAVGGLDLGQPFEGVEHHRCVLVAVARAAQGFDELEVGPDEIAQ